MKKLLLIPALMLGTLAMATQYDYEISPMIGYNINEHNLDLNNNMTVGGEIQFNNIGENIHPEISLFYGAGEYEGQGALTDKKTDMWRVALNGVYEFDSLGFFTPLAKAGIGYRTLDVYKDETEDSIFLDAGVGAKIPLTDHFAIKTEAIYMLDYNHKRYDSNLMLLVGLNYAFGGGDEQKPAPVAEEEEFVDGDDDNDGVLNSADSCLGTPVSTQVDSSGCRVDGDDDNDGVFNSIDQCPNTPTDTDVYGNGCKTIVPVVILNDDDKDGVANSNDKCKNTPAGTTVDADGCDVNADDDKDGVVNSKDICPNTEAGSVVNSDGCPAKLDLHIKFGNNSSNIAEESLPKMHKYADFLNKYTAYSANIVGYTDSRGKASYNQHLSEKRANAVRDMLIDNGVDTSRVTAVGKGEANPIADNNTKEGRAHNRRIEAELTKN